MFAFIRGYYCRPNSIPIIWLLLSISLAPAVDAASLDLPAAETMALERDARLAGLAERRQALQEDAVAAAQLPDPQLRFGALNLPTDSFAVDQEPMTQIQLGLRQQFPRGHTRSLSRGRAETLAAAEARPRRRPSPRGGPRAATSLDRARAGSGVAGDTARPAALVCATRRGRHCCLCGGPPPAARSVTHRDGARSAR